MTYYCACCLSEHESPDFVCTDCEGDPMATMHERPAAGAAAWLADEANSGGGSTPTPVGAATIRDDGANAIVSYEVVAQISHDQMLDLLEETR